MARILVINLRVPWPLQDGNSLRVFQLARHLEPGHTCHVACLQVGAEHADALRQQGCFRSVTLLPPLPTRRHWRRFLRLGGNRDYLRQAYPGFFAASCRILQDIVDRERIEVVVATTSVCEEFMRPLRGVAKLLDHYDCATLAAERNLAARKDLGAWQRFELQLGLRRSRARETGLTRHCDLMTAISPPDVARLRELNPDGAPVELMPNGVDAGLLELPPAPEPGVRGVTFWGNLGYGVNRFAIEYFYRDIWLPWLEPAGVRWAIVGPNADAWVHGLAERHPEIEVPGFMPDLFAHLASYPIMVNPMRTGTGLKNKVLEAMAAGKTVVTTSMGVDAFSFADGVHGRVADDPAAFAHAVLELLDAPAERRRLAAAARDLVRAEFTWDAVGERWSALLTRLATERA